MASSKPFGLVFARVCVGVCGLLLQHWPFQPSYISPLTAVKSLLVTDEATLAPQPNERRAQMGGNRLRGCVHIHIPIWNLRGAERNYVHVEQA